MCDHPNREEAMTVLQRDPDGVPTVWCDPCVAPIVDALNAAGHPTIASCCGHGRRPGRIDLADGTALLVTDADGADRLGEPFPPITADLD
jgi:hypothetical protein